MSAPRREEGFTVIEMIVTALILTVGALTVFGLFSAATKNTQRAKGTQVALDRAQQELEALRGLTPQEVAMKSMPSHLSNPLNPDYRVNGERYALNREPPTEYSTMVVEGDRLESGGVVENAAIEPGPVPFESGDVKGEVYRYVVWRDDPASTTRTEDYKQVIVAVKLTKLPNEAAERGYVEVQSDFVDPKDSPKNDPPPGSEEEATGQQFFLSDTPCAQSGATERQQITGDHLLHNTLGVCADGLHNGTEPGAPDALLLSSPPDPTPEDPSTPALYDYSNDNYLDTNPDTAKGVQIRSENSQGCNYVPTGDPHPESQIHRWVSDPLASDFTMTGDATLEFYSRSLTDSQPSTGTVCVYLFVRREGSGNPPTDELLTNRSSPNPGSPEADWKFTPSPEETWNGFWPRFRWATLRLKMSFNEAPRTVHTGERLGIALSVERANTAPTEAIPIMFDHPLYATRLEVDTTTPIGG